MLDFILGKRLYVYLVSYRWYGQLSGSKEGWGSITTTRTFKIKEFEDIQIITEDIIDELIKDNKFEPAKSGNPIIIMNVVLLNKKRALNE